jgi:hypothetical protein
LGEIDIRQEEPNLAKEAMQADPMPEQEFPMLTPAGREPTVSSNGESIREETATRV